MDQHEAGLVDQPLPSESLRIRGLEERYIELLERRIAGLEASEKKEQVLAPIQTSTIPEETSEECIATQGQAPAPKADAFLSPIEPRSPGPDASRIRFQELKYDKDGMETIKDVSELVITTTAEKEQKMNDSPDLIWLRAFTSDGSYDYSDVDIESVELRALLHITLDHDPRFQSTSDDTSLLLTTPFQPLIHNLARLEELADLENNDGVRNDLEHRIYQLDSDQETENSDKIWLSLALAGEGKIKKASEELGALLKHVRMTQELQRYFPTQELQKQGQAIQFEALWTIFPPGELVWSTVFMQQDQVFIVKDSSSTISSGNDYSTASGSKKSWSLVCWTYDWDGKTFDRAPITFRFEEFKGAKPINALPCHPLRYHNVGVKESDQELKGRLIKRGERYRELCIMEKGHQMFDYDGLAITHGSGFQHLKEVQNEDSGSSYWADSYSTRRQRLSKAVAPNNKKGKQRHISGRVMVDFESYLQHAPNIDNYGPMGDASFSDGDYQCKCTTCLSNKALKETLKGDYDDYDDKKDFIEPEQYLICPPRVLGYHLDSKTWVELDMNNIVEIAKIRNKDAFDKLELAKLQKDLIQELVESHTSGTGREPLMKDVMKEKGKGLVVLLHGPPGVGKTLTAESVAQLAGKPLFSVGPSDIGLNPTVVESNLEALFELAGRWHAVLLFDEADVFLESRSSHSSDLTRNALVSVLLRVLEYYSGILILTTNRIQQFDIAVQSRVNLGIKYKDLTMEEKRKIFNNFIDQIREDRIDDKEGLRRWFQENNTPPLFESLNGRQVRNVLFSAASLAMKDGGVLQKKHVERMATSTWLFQDSIKFIVQEARRRAEVGRE